jgi:serine/threonine protein kinase
MNNKNIVKLKYLTNGSYGIVFKDDKNNVYKLTSVGFKYIIDVCNFTEYIFFNMIHKYSDDKPILLLQNNKTSFITHDNFFVKYEIDNKIFNKFYKTRLSFDNPYFILNTVDYYKYNLEQFLYKYKDYCVNNFGLIAKKILIGLGPLHHNGFIHGDIKSSNILINNFDDIVITDFGGIKSIYSELYAQTCSIITRCPEDLKFEMDCDNDNNNKVNIPSIQYINSKFRSDIWSLGMIFMEILIGYNPILNIYNKYKLNGYSDKQIEEYVISYITTIKNNELNDIIKLNPTYYNTDITLTKITKVIDKMLEIDPNSRIETIDQVYWELFDEVYPCNYKLEYEYNYKGVNIDKILKIRKEKYNIIMNACSKMDKIYILPLLIDVLDRFLIKIFELEMYKDYSSAINELEIKLLSSSILFIISGFFNYKTINMNDIIKNFNIVLDDSKIIFDNMNKIIRILDYDIYRPFNIYNCLNNDCVKCNNKDEHGYNEKNKIIYIKSIDDEKKLLSCIIDIIQNDKIGIDPNYYYDKMIK